MILFGKLYGNFENFLKQKIKKQPQPKVWKQTGPDEIY